MRERSERKSPEQKLVVCMVFVTVSMCDIRALDGQQYYSEGRGCLRCGPLRELLSDSQFRQATAHDFADEPILSHFSFRLFARNAALVYLDLPNAFFVSIVLLFVGWRPGVAYL